MSIIKKVSPLVVLVFLGCESDKVSLMSDRNNSHITKEQKSNKIIKGEDEKFLNRLGLSYQEDKIIIDFNKTDHFFKELEKSLEDINVSRDAGVLIDETSLSIDLNKTQNLLKNLSDLFQNILFDKNSTSY
jgi:hypothetical protein